MFSLLRLINEKRVSQDKYKISLRMTLLAILELLMQ